MTSIELTPQFQKNFVINKHSGYRLRIDVTNSVDISPKIFRYYESPPDPVTGVSTQEFTGVCSLVDMEELPEDSPNPTDCPKAFRLGYMDVVVDTESLANEVWELVQEEVALLVQSFTESTQLELGISVVIDG